MGVYINMEMPEECSRCPLLSEAGYCNGTNELTAEELESLWRIVGRPSWCPLVEIPPHGRTIDADAFTKYECNNCDGACEALPCDCLNCEDDCRCDFIKDIAEAPTVIPAEEGET